MTSIRDQIEHRLQALKPELLEIVDDSASHAGHVGASTHAARQGSSPPSPEGTHFEITVVSAAFAGKPLVARHRMIYALLDDLMKTQIHALKIDAQVSP